MESFTSLERTDRGRGKISIEIPCDGSSRDQVLEEFLEDSRRTLLAYFHLLLTLSLEAN